MRRNQADDIRKVAKERLGFGDLRPGQLEGITAVLSGKDTLVIQPTGSGKSAIYQIAGLMLEGSTVVVSPLIALQKDQVDSIAAQESADAVAVNSTQRTAETREIWERVEQGQVEYIFLAPEQLRKPETLERLQQSQVSLFVVDEAHCISSWGHDFRPDYLGLGQTIEALGRPPVLALTATATPEVREEIVKRLRLRDPEIFVRGFDRPNIYLRVDHFKTEAEKRDALVHRAVWADKPGIIYTGTRKAAEEIARALRAESVEAVTYHGGMKSKDRHDIQQRFMSGDAEVIVATNAFGMGVDKPDVRFVYHHLPADSLDSYYQEIGRAGRDGERSEAILFYRAEDIGSQNFKASEGSIDPGQLEELAARIATEEGPVDTEKIGEDVGLSQRKLTIALHRLEDTGAAEILPGGEIRVSEDIEPAQAAQIASEDHERLSQAARERLEQMRAYADTASCRREFLLRYLGDEFEGPCGHCDRCEVLGPVTVDPAVGTRREVS
uniref:ATP-dependent DNA helicase RecQ n=1 Tax=Solibacter usitatus (strain Ellin6076) TaxID=234267 RepID=Q02B27_SOLUE